MYKIISGAFAALSLLLIPSLASAHVIVTPGQAGIGKEVTFNVSVPNEKQVPITNLKLDIPPGVTNVVPTTLAGWTVSTTGSNDITSISWSGDTIPVGQRQDFSFSAQVPALATQLNWKAYQTYADGSVVHWDQQPAGSDDSTGDAGPYSVTKVVNDLTNTAPSKNNDAHTSLAGPYVVAGLALLTAVAGLVVKRK